MSLVSLAWLEDGNHGKLGIDNRVRNVQAEKPPAELLGRRARWPLGRYCRTLQACQRGYLLLTLCVAYALAARDV